MTHILRINEIHSNNDSILINETLQKPNDTLNEFLNSLRDKICLEYDEASLLSDNIDGCSTHLMMNALWCMYSELEYRFNDNYNKIIQSIKNYLKSPEFAKELEEYHLDTGYDEYDIKTCDIYELGKFLSENLETLLQK